MKKDDKIINGIMFIPPIVGIMIIMSIYGWHSMIWLLLLFPGWAMIVFILMIINSVIEDRVEEWRSKIKLDSLIMETFYFSKKQWRNLSKDEQSKLRHNNFSLKKIKTKILSAISESTWLKMELKDKLATIETTVSLLQNEFLEQKLLKKKEIEEQKKIYEQKEREKLNREEIEHKINEERQKREDDYKIVQKNAELEKQKKLEEEKKHQEKIERQERIDQEYKDRIKRELLEKERKMELESEAIRELEAEGKLTKDHFNKHERRFIPSHIKQAVWKRDKQQCVHCGSQKDLEFDHIVPVSMGGSNSLNNIQLLCFSCNRIKSNKIM